MQLRKSGDSPQKRVFLRRVEVDSGPFWVTQSQNHPETMLYFVRVERVFPPLDLTCWAVAFFVQTLPGGKDKTGVD